jgi:uncharacterized protein DUF4350
MFTPRNVILAVVAITVLSLIGTCVSLLSPPDGGGVRDDSYGTRAQGHRALFETLTELRIPVRRQLHPPGPSGLDQQTLVLWNPQPELVSTDPSYLKNLQPWVESGGRIVLAVEHGDVNVLQLLQATRLTDTSVFEALGLDHVSITSFSPEEGGEQPLPPGIPDIRKLVHEDVDYQKLAKQFFGSEPETHQIRTTMLDVRGTGSFEPLNVLVHKLSANPQMLAEIKGSDGSRSKETVDDETKGRSKDTRPTTNVAAVGTVIAKDSKGAEHVIAAALRRGQGEIVVLSVPALAHNLNVSVADNAVLLTHLLAGSRRGVVFDEFYHGLTIRGNPMWLFAQRTYGTVALVLLSLAAIVAWRQSVFLGPAIGLPAASRRSLGEYLEAMSRFLLHGRDALAFVVREVRAGLVWSVRKECGLPPEKDDIGDAVGVIARRDPARARRLEETLSRLDDLLSTRRSISESRALSELKQVTSCLSQNAIEPFAKKS